MLNRFLKVELGVSLKVVATVLVSYNLVRSARHRSPLRPPPDSRRHRSAYLVGGAVITALMVLAAPHLANRLAVGVDAISVTVTVAGFVAMGAGMYGAGTMYFV